MLFAVHISDGILTAPWLVGGFALAGLLWLLGAFRIRDEDIPQTALVTAAIFISSSIHIRIGFSSVHLLGNSLAGVVLGRRAGLAIGMGLLLQALLLNHGGIYSLGVNIGVQAAPALVAWGLFRGLHRVSWLYHPALRSLLVGTAVFAWLVMIVFSVALLVDNFGSRVEDIDVWQPARLAFHPLSLAVCLLGAGMTAIAERRMESTPEFPFGLLLGELTVFLTVALNCVVLLIGGVTHWPLPPLVLLVLHLPIAVIEGIVLGVVLGFLQRVKPEMLGTSPSSPAPR